MTVSMKTPFVLACLIAAASAGASPRPSQQESGVANPASEFCVAQGGKSILRGSTGYCRLPDGRMVEEWAHYREHSEKDEDGDQAVGMSSPAAEHCAATGGRNVTRRDRNGSEAAYCRLRNGRTVDAWKLYRQSERRSGEPTAVTRYCTSQGGRLLSNDDGTHGCRTRQGDVFGAQQFYDMHHGERR